jgi:hypothetical protein
MKKNRLMGIATGSLLFRREALLVDRRSLRPCHGEYVPKGE